MGISSARNQTRRPNCSFSPQNERGKALTVLADIPQDSKLVKVSTSTLSSDRLLERDLNVGNVVLVEGALEEHVAEPEDEEVLDHFLSEVVIDSERLLLGPLRLEVSHHLSRRVKVLSKRLLDDDSVDAGGRVVVLLETSGNGDEDGGRESHLTDRERGW
jgi:hypothetical protein